MILDTVTKTLELVLGTAQTTTAMPVTIDYVDMTTTTTVSGSLDFASNGTTLVTIGPAPAASTQRKFNLITVYNADSISKEVTIRLNNNTVLRPIVVVSLSVGDMLSYTDTVGWKVTDTYGAIHTVATADVGAAIAAAPSKTTPIGADKIGIWDSVTGLLNGVLFSNLNLLWANIAGSASQVFSVAPATAASHAVPLSQTTGQNLLDNASGWIYQRAIAATADDTYFADRWYALTQTGTILPSIMTDPEDGYVAGIRLTQSQATAQRFGYAQIVEGKNCKHGRGKSGVFVPRIRASASQPIRYAILGWTGTVDVVTSDVVLDWTSTSYTAGGFFLASNVSVLASGVSTPTANTWTSLPQITGALVSTFNNLIVMVWTEGTAAQNFTFDFDYNQLEIGSVAKAFEYVDYEDDLAKCKFYYETGIFYGTTSTTEGIKMYSGIGDFNTEKRTIPTITTSGFFDVNSHGLSLAATPFADVSSRSLGPVSLSASPAALGYRFTVVFYASSDL